MALPVRSSGDQRDVAAWSPQTVMEELAGLEQATRRLSRVLDHVSAPDRLVPEVDHLARLPHGAFRPPADIEETDDAYVVEIELPGVQRGDLEVEVMGRRLTVSGERKERERRGILRRRARTVGRFRYEVLLPEEVDDGAAGARLQDGVLSVTVPKASSERRPRRRLRVD